MKETNTTILKDKNLQNSIVAISDELANYVEKEVYIEDKTRFALKELEKENEYNIRNEEVDNKLDYTLQEILSIKNSTTYSDVHSIIHFGNIKIESDKKFSRFSKWLYKKLFGWTIEDAK